MLSFEHDYDDHDHMQFLCFSPEQQNITLMPEEEKQKPGSSRKRKPPQFDRSKNDQEKETPKDYERRISHRDAERKRRQEMATLYTSLRSILPQEYVKRKSISNDMHGAVNYINHLKEKIGGLMKKRDELKKLMDVGSSFAFDHEKTSVTVRCGKTGMEIILKTSSMKGYPLSKFLRVVNGEGMAVVNCTSTRANEALIHVVQCEMDAEKSCDQTKLEKRLRDLANGMRKYFISRN